MAKVETDSAAGNPTILNKIMDALGGPEEFFKVFEITQEITPRSALFEMQTLDTDVNTKVKKAEGILKIQKPSLLI